MELLLFLNVKSKNAVKLARKTHENLFNRAAFFSFVEKLESWLERSNTPLQQLIHYSSSLCVWWIK